METTKKLTVSIIGFGKLGKAFYRIFKEKKYTINSVFSKSEYDIPEYLKGFDGNKNALGELVFITVPDAEILNVAQDLARDYANFDKKHIIHCSGTYSSDLLIELQNKGAKIASYHPMQAITETTSTFANTTFDAEGDEKTLEILEQISDDLGANFIRIEKEAKIYLHTASVIASNYLVVLMNLALKAANLGEIKKDTIENALILLMQSSLDNIKRNGTDNALTGPVARGDVPTIKKHVDGLKNEDILLKAYKLLGEEAATLSNADSEKISEILKVLKS